MELIQTKTLNHGVERIGLDPLEYGTHAMRDTKATLIYGCSL